MSAMVADIMAGEKFHRVEARQRCTIFPRHGGAATVTGGPYSPNQLSRQGRDTRLQRDAQVFNFPIAPDELLKARRHEIQHRTSAEVFRSAVMGERVGEII